MKRRASEPSARAVRDERLKEQIMRVWKEIRKGRGLYGARKVWPQLRREGVEVARCTVERLMREMGVAGVSAQRRKPRTTVPDAAGQQPTDLLERDFATDARQSQLADLELRHRRRARCEDRIRAAKDTGLRHLPLHGLAQNQI